MLNMAEALTQCPKKASSFKTLKAIGVFMSKGGTNGAKKDDPS
jgi:hypothetical protein